MNKKLLHKAIPILLMVITLFIEIPISRAGFLNKILTGPDHSDRLKKLIERTCFRCDQSEGVFKLDNGLVITFMSPIPSDRQYKGKNDDYYCEHYGSGYYGYLTVDGMSIKIDNVGKKVLIIKWWESTLSVGDYTGAPLLDNVKYEDANTTRIPDTPIAPGQQSIYKDIYLSRLETHDQRRVVDTQYLWDEVIYTYENYKTYTIIGECIPKDSVLKFVLLLKVNDNRGDGKYYKIDCPPIGVSPDGN